MMSDITYAHSIKSSGGFIKNYVITMRPYLMFVSGIAGIAGISFMPGNHIVKMILIFIAAFLSYGFGQALTDCFQIDTDSISSPYRPLTQKKLSIFSVMAVSIIGLTACVSVFTYFNKYNLIYGIIAGLGLATYTWFKKIWWAGPFYNAWIITVLFLISYLASSIFFVDYKVIYFITVVFFGYANFVLSGYFKDIEADRATGYNTLLVVYGRKISAIVSDIFSFLFIAPAILYLYFYRTPDYYFLPFLIGGIYFAATAQFRLHKVKTDEEAHVAIAPVVHSYILVISAISVLNKPDLFYPLIAFYLLFLLFLKMRPSQAQI